MKLHLRENVLYEGVLTASLGGEIYVSPVGFRRVKDIVEIKVYKGGLLEKVIREQGEIILNITHDPLILTETAFKSKMMTSRSVEEYVEFNEDGVILRDSIGYVLLERMGFSDIGEYYLVKYKVKKIATKDDQNVEPFSRCYGALVEIAVYISKINALKNNLKLVSDYQSRVSMMLEVVNKTCSEEYTELAHRLIKVHSIHESQSSNKNTG
ncbi:MAG: DUF447 family protein [Desulfurococcaceae archaeon]